MLAWTVCVVLLSLLLDRVIRRVIFLARGEADDHA